MKITLVTAFAEFLEHDTNSSKEFLKELPDKEGLIKKTLPVGYFKKEFIKPIKEHKPNKIVYLGMNKSIKIPKLETITLNKKITLKNPFYRILMMIYSYYLKWNNKNLRIKKPISKEKLKIIPIQKNKPEKITLKTKPPILKNIKISKNAGNYVCNYSMWVVENYIRKRHLNIQFFFIHVPINLTKTQKQELIKFILN